VSLSPGDPGSASALGGALRTQAARLADLVVDLDSAASRVTRSGATDPSGRERELVTRAAGELDRVGALLQSWTTTAVESAAGLRSLEPALTRSDLAVDGHIVVERGGPSRVEPAQRLAERERLQELLNRVTALRARELARLRRELEHSHASLAALSDRARSGT
jgi:hypothetical protein